MKKTVAILLAALMLCISFAGCAPSGNNGADLLPTSGAETVKATEDTSVTEPSEEPAQETADAPADTSSTTTGGGAAADSYTAYINAKSVVVSKITDGLTNNADTAMTALSVLGFLTADLSLLPASFFGLGEQSVESGLSMIGATDVQYTENGNSYTIAYKDEEGKAYDFSGTFDPATDSLTCTASTDGVEILTAEYHKTSFGYVGQYYFSNEDGTTQLYQVAVKGEDGTLGLSSVAGKPAALTGSEAPNFPTACPEWYSVSGQTITGVTSDGKQLNFEYTPTPSAAQ